MLPIKLYELNKLTCVVFSAVLFNTTDICRSLIYSTYRMDLDRVEIPDACATTSNCYFGHIVSKCIILYVIWYRDSDNFSMKEIVYI